MITTEQRQTFNMSIKSMRNSLDHFIYCIFLLYPRYEVYRGYIVFAFFVIMFVCLSVCLFVCL